MSQSTSSKRCPPATAEEEGKASKRARRSEEEPEEEKEEENPWAEKLANCGYSYTRSISFADDGDLTSFCEALAANKTLTVLILFGCRLGDAGMLKIAAAVSRNGALETLDVSNNGFGIVGATALGRCLQENSTLRVLSVSHNKIGTRGLPKIIEGVRHRNLSALYCSDVDGELSAASLRTLFDSERMCLLETLDLSQNRFSDEGAISLFEAMETDRCMLRDLNLSETDMTHLGFSAAIRYLRDARVRGGALRTLQRLDLTKNLIGHESRGELETFLGRCRLKQLILDGNPLDDASIGCLGSGLVGCSLEHLSLAGVDCTSVGLQRLFEKVGANRRLQTLDVTGITLHDDDVLSLADKIGRFQALVTLRIGSWISEGAMQYLLRACEAASTIRSVEIGSVVHRM